jgi:hypothetical protein
MSAQYRQAVERRSDIDELSRNSWRASSTGHRRLIPAAVILVIPGDDGPRDADNQSELEDVLLERLDRSTPQRHSP